MSDKFDSEWLKNYEVSHPPSCSFIKQIVRNEPLAEVKRKEAHSGRVSVVIKSYRRRLTDPDNLCGKFFLDCCRYAGFLRDDTAAEIDFSITQEKVKRKEDEKTTVEITAL